ncbi:diphthine--ammonia ligase-like isoform X2 [Artemia franciscana]|uniref:Diphthine--ammonia ligase n=1 Tax=Artemia franciscana TaxID=6661 RepID=A0AA88KXE8_ARTSF|nr:hypothetical protein QYM36_015497 [Artemia franciscana]
MKVVGLISGGKDSIFNLCKCVEAGHQVVALANLYPLTCGEEDSHMYQTVGHDAIEAVAKALDLPLYRRPIKGVAKEKSLEYLQTDGDEVEDLYCLLEEVKGKEDIEAVSVGAILSSYQNNRVENVCDRLGLVPLAYLWKRDQDILLQEMIDSGMNAILIKVAALGLDPVKHLGMNICQVQPHLRLMAEKYGLNVCGEGGEYETLALDCPLYKHRIVVDEAEFVIHSQDPFASVGYLRFKKLSLVEKL